jgi:anti-sigma regulatory factor (Ser/Thr protein kinase)
VPIEVERNIAGAGDHVVLFYERDEDLVRSVRDYLLGAVEAGQAAVVIATEDHRRAFERQLQAAGVDLVELVGRGNVQMLDAAGTLSGFYTDGQVDHEAFIAVLGAALRQATGGGRRVRLYGEMVALLWEAGDVPAAIELEGLWNNLLRDVPSTLFCAYPSESVSGSRHRDALREVCGLHTSVLSRDSRHEVGGSRPRERSRHFAAELGAPASARRFVVAALRSDGHETDVVDDAALVLTELAANALMHARSAFRVAVTSEPGLVCISVHDASPVLPIPRDQELMAQSGRGLGLVAAVSRRWGVDLTPDGKVVWAELRR